MTLRERDRLVALKKADRKLITQKQAAQQIGLSERQVRRLLAKLRGQGDQPVIHAARGRCSNRKISAQVEKQAVAILSQPEYAGLGPGCGNPAGGSCGVKGLRVVPGLRGGKVRLESRLDGNLAARFGQHDLALQRCLTQPRSEDAKKQAAAAPAEQAARPAPRRQGSGWMDNFDLKKGPSLWLAARASGAGRDDTPAAAPS